MKKFAVILALIIALAAFCLPMYADDSEAEPAEQEAVLDNEPMTAGPFTVLYVQCDENRVELLAGDVLPFTARYITIEDISAIPVSDGALEVGAAIDITFKDFFSSGEITPTDKDILKIEISAESSPLDPSDYEAVIAKMNSNLKSEGIYTLQFDISSDGKVTKRAAGSPNTGMVLSALPIATALAVLAITKKRR